MMMRSWEETSGIGDRGLLASVSIAAPAIHMLSPGGAKQGCRWSSAVRGSTRVVRSEVQQSLMPSIEQPAAARQTPVSRNIRKGGYCLYNWLESRSKFERPAAIGTSDTCFGLEFLENSLFFVGDRVRLTASATIQSSQTARFRYDA